MAQKSLEWKRVAPCLYRNGNKMYFALIKVRRKQIKRSLKTDDLALAKRRLASMQEKLRRQKGKQNRDIRFEELAESWLESIKPDLKASSHQRRQVAIIGLTPYFKGKLVRSIGYSDIDEWKSKRGASIAHRTYNIELETLNLLFKKALKLGILLDNPAEEFKRQRQPETVVELPTRAQFSALVQALRSSPKAVASGAADMVEFLAYSGMRVGEAREVRFHDVSAESILITGGTLRTKNHKERTIPLFPALKNLLTRLEGKNQSGDRKSKIFKILSPRNAMIPACARAALPNFTVHSLRHFFASNAIEDGVNYKAISKWLGHSDGGVLVLKLYGHLRDEFADMMAKRMTYQVTSD